MDPTINTMVSHPFLHFILFFLLVSLASSTTLTNDIFHSPVLLGRTLLQQKTACSIDFENQNYTIITRQCKGPDYQVKECCGALKELACPFAEKINDMKNDCATTLFSYINVYGNYPPGLFSNLCGENKDGISCKEILETKAKESGGATAISTKSPMVMILTLMLLCNLL